MSLISCQCGPVLRDWCQTVYGCPPTGTALGQHLAGDLRPYLGRACVANVNSAGLLLTRRKVVMWKVGSWEKFYLRYDHGNAKFNAFHQIMLEFRLWPEWLTPHLHEPELITGLTLLQLKCSYHRQARQVPSYRLTKPIF